MFRAATPTQMAFRDRLVDAGILVPSSVAGVWGRGRAFAEVFDGLGRFVAEAGRTDAPEVFRFPPVISRETFVRSDYLRSFPDLIGSIHGFDGGNAEHASLLRDLAAGADWTSHLRPSEVMLLPAACYPIYPMIGGTLPEEGRLFDVLGSCYRNEPSDDPARMQTFHQQEYVRVGSPDAALAFRDDWLERSQQLMDDLRLRVVVEVANDPFFGRAGSMLAANQREHALKFEVLAPVSSEEQLTAIVSCNCHQDHLTVPFGITTPGGEHAHSACVGFGLERIVLGLFAEHGFDPERWPFDVRKRLWQ